MVLARFSVYKTSTKSPYPLGLLLVGIARTTTFVVQLHTPFSTSPHFSTVSVTCLSLHLFGPDLTSNHESEPYKTLSP